MDACQWFSGKRCTLHPSERDASFCAGCPGNAEPFAAVSLFPCPFCGEAGATPIRAEGRVLNLYVYCDNCNAEAGHGDTPMQAIAAWNRRDTTDLDNESRWAAQYKAERDAARKSLAYLESVMCFPYEPLRVIDEGEPIHEVDPIRLGDVIAERDALAADLAVARKWSARWKALAGEYKEEAEYLAEAVERCCCDAGECCAELAALRAAMPLDAAGLLRAAGARPLKRTERAAARAWAARLDAAGEVAR